MGVHGLWELLAPVGRRVSVETLAGKRLAIDASIWLVQFMKAMRDEKGEMVRNAHLLGFFRRICKLLFLRTKPVFVFDGGTPALKRRTVIARRRQRENAQAKVRKTAEKLLLNHMKAMKLKELADDIKNQRQKQKSNAKGRKNNSDQIDMVGSDSGRSDVISCSYDAQKLDSMSGPNITAEQDQNLTENACKSPTAVPSDRKDGGEETLVKHIRKQEKNQENGFKSKKILSDQNDLGGCYVDENVGSTSCNQERLDEMLVASIVAEEDGILAKNGVASAAVVPSEDDSDADEEMILTGMNAEVDPAILDALPPSMQLDLLVQHKGKKKEELGKDVENQRRQWLKEDKGKGILLEQVDRVARQSRKDDVISRSYSQEKVDELLAASIAAEEDGRLANNASEFNGAFTSKEEDSNDDGDEEMILPAIHGEVDPAVLASLPPSMQLDLLVQMRERLMAENRQKYQKVKKDPTKFSELQIQAYLKTVSFRREIDEVQKAAAGRGVGGVHTSRIASESNREYIFSSSFTGDKQELTSMRAERNDYNQQQTLGEHPSQDSMNSNAPTNKSNNAKGLVADMSVDESIQTYLDERGHFRVSRLRALGMRMTRDIQRNLDLMKEIEQEKTNVNEIADAATSFNAKKNGTPRSSYNHQVIGASHEGNVDFVELGEGNEQSVLKNDTSIEISFEDDHKCLGGDDQLFASLVAGNPVTISSNSNPSSKKQLSESDSDCDWEEGNIEGNASFNNVNMEMKSSVAVHDIIDENEVEWEEGVSDSFKNASSCPAQSGKAVSRGLLEEEANFQEAIRRSLEDLGDESTLSEHENPNISSVKYNYGLSQDEIREGSGVKAFDNDVSLLNQENNTGGSIVIGKDSGQQIGSYSEIVDGVEKLDGMGWGNGMQTVDPLRKKSESSVKYLINMGIQVNTPLKTYPGSHSEESSQDANGRMINEVHDGAEQLLDISNEDGNISTDHNSPSTVNPSIPCPVQEYKKNNDDELPSCHATELTVTPLMGSSKEESKKEDIDEKLATVITQGNYCIEKEINNGK
ncbi:DNA repair protein UVH3 [Quillaja saponaria]|uniref:DNA repair protein UVH3 n=1 Tax=Quillaja saponaria TaxID=32244 RepID=A0AAD7Q4A9_QUISA|nr:DNA repair protein UVH3 [Quillaja saponaria]